MEYVNDSILLLSGIVIILISIAMLLLILAVKRNHIRSYRILAVVFSMIGDTGMLMVIIGICQSFGSFL